jgi:hypothetical protein
MISHKVFSTPSIRSLKINCQVMLNILYSSFLILSLPFELWNFTHHFRCVRDFRPIAEGNYPKNQVIHSSSRKRAAFIQNKWEQQYESIFQLICKICKFVVVTYDTLIKMWLKTTNITLVYWTAIYRRNLGDQSGKRWGDYWVLLNSHFNEVYIAFYKLLLHREHLVRKSMPSIMCQGFISMGKHS